MEVIKISKLSELQGKSKTYTIGGIELDIKPLKLDDMNLFTIDQNATPAEQAKSSLKMIDKVLLEAVPDSTEEERKGIGLEYMDPLMKAIMEVNGMDKKVNIKDVIKSRTAQIKS